MHIHITQGNEYCKLQIENAIQNSPIFDEKGNLQSTKLDRKNHSLGLQNVKTTVERNNGEFSISVVEDRFICSILLKNKLVFDR